VLGVSSASAAVDVALSELIRRHRVLDDVRAYTRSPPTDEEAALGQANPDWSDLADDTDWEAEWPEDNERARGPRGEIWLAEQDKRRPVVLTRDPLGRLLHSVIVGPVTSTVRGLNTEVALTEADGIRRTSVVNLDNLSWSPERAW